MKGDSTYSQFALEVVTKLEQVTKGFPRTMTYHIQQEYGRDPFYILISCLLSLRARDSMTLPVSRQLFSKAKNPQDILNLSTEELETILHPLGFYRQKTQTLKNVSQILIDKYDGQVPSDEAELLSIKGIGRKTSALVRSVAFDIPAICVDVHVHRIANEIGLVKTKSPEDTEYKLMELYEPSDWSRLNYLFVIAGQNMPLSEIKKLFKK